MTAHNEVELYEAREQVRRALHAADNANHAGEETVLRMAAANTFARALRGVLSQFDHVGCSCTFQSDDCCAYAEGQALLKRLPPPPLPHEVLKPRLSKDGDQWCALHGENLQEGVAGFGDTPSRAYDEFDRNWASAGGRA